MSVEVYIKICEGNQKFFRTSEIFLFCTWNHDFREQNQSALLSFQQQKVKVLIVLELLWAYIQLCSPICLFCRCARLHLQPLAYLWRRDQEELLNEMISSGLDAIIIKVAAFGRYKVYNWEFSYGQYCAKVLGSIFKWSCWCKTMLLYLSKCISLAVSKLLKLLQYLQQPFNIPMYFSTTSTPNQHLDFFF